MDPSVKVATIGRSARSSIRARRFSKYSSTQDDQALSTSVSFSMARLMFTAGWPNRAFMLRLIEPSLDPVLE